MSLLSLSPWQHYYLFNGATDMRQTFNGLTNIIRSQLGHNPLSGDVFIFFNRKRNQAKLILWETDGFGIYHKRLEQGTFEVPGTTDERKDIPMNWQQLQFILQGIQLQSVQYRKRYKRQTAIAL